MLVTPFIAALLALMYVFLSLWVIRFRFGERISHGDGDNRDLRVAIRIHANFIEYVPIALLLMWFIETALFDRGFSLVLGVILVVARIMHVFGMQNPKKFMILRQLGVIASLSVLIAASVRILWFYLPIQF